jgi:hypothetical protein
MKLAKTLQALRPGKEFTYNDEDLSTVQWNDPSIVTPTQAEVDAEIARQEQEALDKKTEAEAKLAALGLTPEDLQALLS